MIYRESSNYWTVLGEKWVPTGVLEALDDPLVVKTKIWKKGWILEDTVQCNRRCVSVWRRGWRRHPFLVVRQLRTISLGVLSFAWIPMADCIIHTSLSSSNLSTLWARQGQLIVLIGFLVAVSEFTRCTVQVCLHFPSHCCDTHNTYHL